VKDIFAEVRNLTKNKALTEWQCMWLIELMEFKDNGWNEPKDMKKYYIALRKWCMERMNDINFLKETLLPKLRKEEVHDDDVEYFVLKLKEHRTSFAQGEYAGGSFSLSSKKVCFFSNDSNKSCFIFLLSVRE
jgi:hypothetical protein